MPSIKQIIAEIQLAQDLGPNQKQFTVRAIRDAEERLKLKAPAAPRKITNAKGLMTLMDWEEKNGLLSFTHHLREWTVKSGLCPYAVVTMIAEFRTEMAAKGKQYANFIAAFQTYLRKGYLSKPMADCTLERSTHQQQTVIHRKGGNL